MIYKIENMELNSNGRSYVIKSLLKIFIAPDKPVINFFEPVEPGPFFWTCIWLVEDE